jgi:hypothetical protein
MRRLALLLGPFNGTHHEPHASLVLPRGLLMPENPYLLPPAFRVRSRGKSTTWSLVHCCSARVVGSEANGGLGSSLKGSGKTGSLGPMLKAAPLANALEAQWSFRRRPEGGARNLCTPASGKWVPGSPLRGAQE